MSQVTRLFAATAVAVVFTVAVMLFVTRPVDAQVGRTAICTSSQTLASSPKWENAEWMNTQLKAGRTQFIQVGALLCAW